MTTIEYLLTCLSEECAEVAQRVSKALRFTLDEVQPGQTETNRARIGGELRDLLVVLEVLKEHGLVFPEMVDDQARAEKRARILYFMSYSAERGTLQ